jgi:amidophosphoribosyltransferase
VFGVYAPRSDQAAQLIYYGLFALQHRGQESAGIATSDGETITVTKDMGLVTQVFDESMLAAQPGHLGIGHTRYSTTGGNRWENAQPVYRHIGDTGLALGHNGNLTNTAALVEHYGTQMGTSDTELMLEAISRRFVDGRSDGRGLERALMKTLPEFEGAFSLVIMDQGHLVGVRDPHGFRPLCLGRLDDDGWVLASETAALDIVGATFIREVEPGEMVVIDAVGVRSLRPFAETDPHLCIFEFVYFARPDSTLYGQSVHAARLRMGRSLAEESPVEADVVVPVPESGIPAAQGFSAHSGIPYVDGLVKNRYIGRTFIQPSQMLRDRGIRMKLNPIPATLAGRRIVLVDDSIVRGTTTRKLVAMCREAGAAEVHLRISSPPYMSPCFYGMDTSDVGELLAANRSIEEIREFVGADSLAYLTLEGLRRSTGAGDAGFCSACLSGQYPTPVPLRLTKTVLEGQSRS